MFPSTTWYICLTANFLMRHQKRKRRSPTHLPYHHTWNLNHFQLFFNEIKHRFTQIFPCSQNVTANTASIERTTAATYLALVYAHSFLVIHYKSPDPDVPAFPAHTRDNGREPWLSKDPTTAFECNYLFINCKQVLNSWLHRESLPSQYKLCNRGRGQGDESSA